MLKSQFQGSNPRLLGTQLSGELKLMQQQTLDYLEEFNAMYVF